MDDARAPYHAHIYVQAGEGEAAEALRRRFQALQAGAEGPEILFVGSVREGRAGPHPISQYEVHFQKSAADEVRAIIAAAGLKALVHPLTDDDLADHTTLADWIGEPLDLDLTTLDPPGLNQGVARFGKSDF
jgi:aromatic ring-cleaving dioxygenase